MTVGVSTWEYFVVCLAWRYSCEVATENHKEQPVNLLGHKLKNDTINGICFTRTTTCNHGRVSINSLLHERKHNYNSMKSRVIL